MSSTDRSSFERYTCTEAHRVMHAHINTAEPYKRNGKAVPGSESYGAVFLISPQHVDLAALKAAAIKVAKDRWPGRKLAELKFPFSSGDENAAKRETNGKDGTVTKGFVLFKTNTKYEPLLSVLEGGRVTEYAGAARPSVARKFYSGAYLVPSVTFHPYEGDAQKPDGVGAWLDAVLFYKDGERIGGSSGADLFKGFAGTVSSVSPTGGATADDDEIPF